MRARRVAVALLAVAIAGCASAPGRPAANPAPSTASAPATAPPTGPPTAPPTSRASYASPVAVPSTAALLPTRLVGVGDAREVVSVLAPGYGTTYATLRAFRRTATGWRRVFGPWPARIGYHGFAPPGKKREGDGRTPTGAFGFRFMFGVYADPGVRFHYRRALRTSWWDDDPASRNYNEWVDSRYRYPGRSPESMHQLPAYGYGVVIGYNTARTPGVGSAIFLHVSHTGPTAGCVSIAQSRLLRLLRWLRPAAGPRIVMGPAAVVTR